MKSWMVDIAKEILIEKQDAHIIAYMIDLQRRADEAFKNDDSHTRSLSKNE